MELTKQQKKQVEDIIRGMHCPKAFKCKISNFTDVPKVSFFGKTLRCLEQNPRDCEWSISFGMGYICQCPLNYYVHRNIIK
jgi:hypothetical protein